ncbi:hypothetical protein EBR43_00580, partial [bacterium]|nr:hypothetical protein [bacterium]
NHSFLLQLPTAFMERLPLWWKCLEHIAIKEKEKPILCQRFVEQWLNFIQVSSHACPVSTHPSSLLWTLFFEWVIAELMQPVRPIIPLSSKKAINIALKTEGFKYSWL